MTTELCPICIEETAEFYTECGHKYCIKCLCKISKCAMCRKTLIRANVCFEIREKKRSALNKSVIHICGMDYNTMRLVASFTQGLTYSN
jgi:hypothetical protein